MSTEPTPSAPVQGYLSEESKRRFTLVAGVLGAVFFLAQFVLPFLIFLLGCFPGMMLEEFRTAHMEKGAIWRGELWYVERVESLSFRDPQNQQPALRLRHASLVALTEQWQRLGDLAVRTIVVVDEKASAMGPTPTRSRPVS